MINGLNNNITKYLNENSVKYKENRVNNIKKQISNDLEQLFPKCPNLFTPNVKTIEDKKMVVISIGKNIENNKLNSGVQRIDLVHAVVRFESIGNKSKGIAHINIHFNDNIRNNKATKKNSFCDVDIPYSASGNSNYFKSDINRSFVVKASITKNTNKIGEFIVNTKTTMNRIPRTELCQSLINIMLGVINNSNFFPRKINK